MLSLKSDKFNGLLKRNIRKWYYFLRESDYEQNDTKTHVIWKSTLIQFKCIFELNLKIKWFFIENSCERISHKYFLRRALNVI